MPAKKKLIGVSIVVLLLAVACNFRVGDLAFRTLPVGELQTVSHSIELGKAQAARARISMGAGELKLAGGADNLMDAEFTTNIDVWTPEVSYAVDDGLGNLLVRQPSSEFNAIPTEGTRNEWNVRLNNDIPLDLDFEVGAGTSKLDLGELSLENVEIRAGVGDSTINLANSSVPKLTVDAGLGAVTVDLSGEWRNDLDAEIRNGIGELTLKLPRDVGVRIDVERGMIDVHTRGLRKSNGFYVNEAYGKSEIMLDIDVKGGLGQINLLLDV